MPGRRSRRRSSSAWTSPLRSTITTRCRSRTTRLHGSTGTRAGPSRSGRLKLNTGKYVVRATIDRELIKPFQDLEAKGVGVMVGEFGCHNQTPHRYVLSWINDTLNAFKKAGFGWALWNFTGSFGVCDSGRFDVAYEDWHGRKLDRAMLELLQAG